MLKILKFGKLKLTKNTRSSKIKVCPKFQVLHRSNSSSEQLILLKSLKKIGNYILRQANFAITRVLPFGDIKFDISKNTFIYPLP